VSGVKEAERRAHGVKGSRRKAQGEKDYNTYLLLLWERLSSRDQIGSNHK